MERILVNNPNGTSRFHAARAGTQRIERRAEVQLKRVFCVSC